VTSNSKGNLKDFIRYLRGCELYLHVWYGRYVISRKIYLNKAKELRA